jgi:hypothetical protein
MRENSKCKGPEAGMYSAQLNSQEVVMAGMEQGKVTSEVADHVGP